MGIKPLLSIQEDFSEVRCEQSKRKVMMRSSYSAFTLKVMLSLLVGPS